METRYKFTEELFRMEAFSFQATRDTPNVLHIQRFTPAMSDLHDACFILFMPNAYRPGSSGLHS